MKRRVLIAAALAAACAVVLACREAGRRESAGERLEARLRELDAEAWMDISSASRGPGGAPC